MWEDVSEKAQIGDDASMIRDILMMTTLHNGSRRLQYLYHISSLDYLTCECVTAVNCFVEYPIQYLCSLVNVKVPVLLCDIGDDAGMGHYFLNK